MLVLTRSSDEEIRIGDDIVIRVLDVKGDRVRIGIAAPAEVAVHRQEVYLEIEKANRESMLVAGAGLEGAQALLKRAKSKSGTGSSLKARSSRGKKKTTRVKRVNTEVENGS